MRKTFTRSLLAAVCCLAALFSVNANAASGKPVVVASTNFPEQLVLANIYADVLEARGVSVKTRMHLGSREIVFPALKAGEVDILPEYAGALLQFLTNGKSKARTTTAVLTELREKLPNTIVALKAAKGEDKDGWVVTGETAREYHLKKMSDLARVASDLTAGGSSQTQSRYIGLQGIKDVYGIVFSSFRPLDSAGPLTQGALESGAIDVARMYSTQGVIQAKGWVLLKDDKRLVPAENLLPVVRKAVLTPAIHKALDAISKTLTTKGLRQMNKRVTVDKQDPETVAESWVRQHHLGANKSS